MSSETQYYCDICDKETPKNDIRTLAIRMITSLNYEELDLCDDCYDKATKHLFDNAESWEKKKLISILKLWLGGRK